MSTNPIIFTSNNFITYKNCDHLISISKNNLMKSLDFNGDKSKFRSGSIAFLNHDNDQVTKELIGKISKLIGMSEVNLEPMQITKYSKHQFYAYHYDAFPFENKIKQFSKNKNYWELRKSAGFHQRLITAQIFLNNPIKGGATRFDKANVTINPEKGKLLLFFNTVPFSNKFNSYSSHSGLPVLDGEKWILTMWFNSLTLEKKFKIRKNILLKKLSEVFKDG